MTEQYIGCQNSDDITLCDSTNKKCCTTRKNIFLIVDLEKRINSDLVIKTYFNYKDKDTGGEEPHPDFLVMVMDEKDEKSLILEILELKTAFYDDTIKYGIALQLLYFYSRFKELLEKMPSFPFDINSVRLLIYVPPDKVGTAQGILEKLKTNPDDSLSSLFKKSQDKRKKIEKVKRFIISTGGRILDRIEVRPCVQINNSY